MNVGVGYRREMADWIRSQPRGVNCLEITADHFPPGSEEHLRKLRGQFPLYVHGLSLSLGTPGPLNTEHVEHFARVAEAANAEWVSEHIAFTRTREGDLGHLNPIPPTRASLAVIADHSREVSQRCRKPMLLENITSHLKLEGDLTETDFLNQLCDRSGCGLLLDVTNLFINSRNHGFDPIAWLHQIDPSKIQQLHIVGYSREGDRYTDAHAQPIQSELIDLASEVVSYAPVKAIVLERDEDIPSVTELEFEVSKLERIGARA